MNMKMNKYFGIALAGAVVMAGCQKKEVDIHVEKPEQEAITWTIKVQAERNDGPETRGLDIEGEDASITTLLQSIWKNGEEVQVYLGEDCIGTLAATPDATDAHKATLSGTVTTTSITPGSTTLTLLTPRAEWIYTGQDGTLLAADNSIEKKYHYTLAADVLVTGAANGVITTAPASFTNQQSIYRLSFRYNNGSTKTPIVTKSVTISSASNQLVLSQPLGGTPTTGSLFVLRSAADTDPFFVALRNGDQQNDEVFTFTVVDNDGVTYRGNKTIPADYKPNGSFVSVKNATLDKRLDLPLNATEVTTVL